MFDAGCFLPMINGSSREQVKIKSFMSHVNKKQNVELYSPVSSGVQGNCMKHVTFSWPPLEAALSLYKFSLFLLKQFLEVINTNNRRLPSMPNHKFCKMSVLMRSVW